VSKILINNTASPILISDTGVNLPVGNYTIAPTSYDLFAASSDVIIQIGNSNLTVNDGSANLSISDGTDLIKGLYSRTVLQGTSPWNVSGNITATLKYSDIQKNTEFTITTKSEADISGTSYTVTTGKTFYLTSFASSSDSPSPVSFRLKIYNGATLINIVKLNVAGNGATNGFSWENGILFANSTYTIKVTVEPGAVKGSGWVMFSGFEV